MARVSCIRQDDVGLDLLAAHLVGYADDGSEADGGPADGGEASASAGAMEPLAQGQAHPHGHGHHRPGLGGIVLTLALTDLAFSLDSVAAAVAVTDRLALVMAGGVIGVVALRLTAELFIRWLELFRHLETAGYLAVGLVGLRLLLRLALPGVEIPDWGLLAAVVLLFLWGFSERRPPQAAAGEPLPAEQP